MPDSVDRAYLNMPTLPIDRVGETKRPGESQDEGRFEQQLEQNEKEPEKDSEEQQERTKQEDVYEKESLDENGHVSRITVKEDESPEKKEGPGLLIDIIV